MNSQDASENSKVRRRRPWLAALLSILLTGLGQLYAGRPRRAIVFFALMIGFLGVVGFGVMPLWRLLLFPGGFWLLSLFIIAIFAVKIFAIGDAWICARRAVSGPLARYQRWYVYFGTWIVFTGPWLVLETNDHRPIESYSIPSRAMTPTVLEGDYIYSINGWYLEHPPARGEIAVFKHPESSVDFIKRIVGLPGEQIQMRSGNLYINGTPITRTPAGDYVDPDDGDVLPLYQVRYPDGVSHLIAEIGDSEGLDDTEEVAIPDGSVFVMGDNRDNSSDSRVFGPVPIANLTDKPTHVYWSRDWSRIGLAIQ